MRRQDVQVSVAEGCPRLTCNLGLVHVVRVHRCTIWLFNSSPWKPWPIEIDGLPINSMVIFHGYVSHNQMVNG